MHQHLQVAETAYRAAALPPLPIRIALPSGLLCGAAVAVAGRYESNGIYWLLQITGAVLLVTAAVGLVIGARRRRGLTGFRGPVRKDFQAHLVSALALLTVAMLRAPGMDWIWVGCGIAVGALVFVSLWKPQRFERRLVR